MYTQPIKARTFMTLRYAETLVQSLMRMDNIPKVADAQMSTTAQ